MRIIGSAIRFCRIKILIYYHLFVHVEVGQPVVHKKLPIRGRSQRNNALVHKKPYFRGQVQEK